MSKTASDWSERTAASQASTGIGVGEVLFSPGDSRIARICVFHSGNKSLSEELLISGDSSFFLGFKRLMMGFEILHIISVVTP